MDTIAKAAKEVGMWLWALALALVAIVFIVGACMAATSGGDDCYTTNPGTPAAETVCGP